MKSKTETVHWILKQKTLKIHLVLNFMKSMFNLVGIELICTPAAVCVSYQYFRGSKQGF